MSITLNGSELTPEQLIAVVDDGAELVIDPAARDRAEASFQTAVRVASRRPVYGRTTGVGANLGVATDSSQDPGLGLIRSHAGGAGQLVGARQAWAMMVVRANQLLVGASGARPQLIDAIAAALGAGVVPQVHEFGSVGTGDLTALAELALALIGEREWAPRGIPGTDPAVHRIDSAPPPVTVDRFDALPLLSSSALTIAQASLAYSALNSLARAAAIVAALSVVALGGSPEPYAAEVHAGRPFAGSVAAAARMRELIEPVRHLSARLQDPYGLRAFPVLQGALLDALAQLRAVLIVELNAGAENPFVSVEADDVFHHGNFHQAPLALALDGVRLALLSNAQLSTARIAALCEPRLTALSPFLANGAPGSSGAMIIEYTAASALAGIRALAMPVAFGNAVFSRGVEEHASFAAQAARQSGETVGPYRVMLAAELVCAVRALRLSGRVPGSQELSDVLTRVLSALPSDTEDRPLDVDLAMAADLLTDLS